MIGNVVGGISSFIGNIGADQQAGAGESSAQNLRSDILRQLMNIELPDIELMQRDYIIPELVGEYTPEMEMLYSLDPTAFENISTDPRLAQSQFAALEQLAELSNGGLSNADIAGLEQVRRNSAAQDQARQQAILQDMQQRGQGGSGAELIAKLKSSQTAADRASQEGLQIAQQAQQRALQALMNQSNLSSSMRNQDFNEQSRIAQAKDYVNQFNTQNKQSVNQRNTGNQNTAQQQNLANRQAIENQRVQLRNQQQDINKNLYQQNFQNEMQRQAPITNQGNVNAGATQQIGYNQAQRTRDMANSFGDMFGGIGGMAGF